VPKRARPRFADAMAGIHAAALADGACTAQSPGCRLIRAPR
jgi:hypothetical protein